MTITETTETENWRKGDWMQTFTGHRFYPLNPQPEDIRPQDIAHALSLLCRFNGHVERFYSVAEHCVLLSEYVAEEHALWALLHDATEAYVGDMVRPLKRSMPEYVAVEDKIMEAIAVRFDLPRGAMPPEVKEADSRILLNERSALMPNTVHKWSVEDMEPLEDTVVRGLPPKTIESMYLDRLSELLEKR